MLTETDESFRDEYENKSDDVLGNDAPSDRYIAKTLGQKSIVYSDS